jgi:hypothetical protein
VYLLYAAMSVTEHETLLEVYLLYAAMSVTEHETLLEVYLLYAAMSVTCILLLLVRVATRSRYSVYLLY